MRLRRFVINETLRSVIVCDGTPNACKAPVLHVSPARTCHCLDVEQTPAILGNDTAAAAAAATTTTTTTTTATTTAAGKTVGSPNWKSKACWKRWNAGTPKLLCVYYPRVATRIVHIRIFHSHTGRLATFGLRQFIATPPTNKTMEVRILSMEWQQEMPIATVVGTTGTVFRMCLLHWSFLQRHQIGVGSRLHVSDTGFLLNVIEATGGSTAPATPPTAFDEWFDLYPQLTPFLSKGVARILFLHGLTTVDAIRRYQQSLENIHGIGPKTERRIREMCSSLQN